MVDRLRSQSFYQVTSNLGFLAGTNNSMWMLNMNSQLMTLSAEHQQRFLHTLLLSQVFFLLHTVHTQAKLLQMVPTTNCLSGSTSQWRRPHGTARKLEINLAKPLFMHFRSRYIKII
ncbi:hypothetical protein B296_00048650 [Ensete ventricosum]|uniref:Uncharacterized protein n=1 Tax=Ensete ventricosum TaxID=4639 RepID=A0A426YQF6_ENSVE|nr:hypothetical protein B296_00048650 [Ensete ventricosum]